jgi:hypothetical protein
MSLLYFLVLIVGVAIAIWAITALVADGRIRNILLIALAVFVVLILLRGFGVLGMLSEVRA